jgi:hypothetical protein
VLKVYILKLGAQNWKTVGSLGNSIYLIKLKIIWLPYTYLTVCQLLLEKKVTYNLRNNDDYRTQRYGLQTSSKSFFPSTIKLWNSLPDSVKSLPTFYKLKKKHSACPNSGGFILQYWR